MDWTLIPVTALVLFIVILLAGITWQNWQASRAIDRVIKERIERGE